MEEKAVKVSVTGISAIFAHLTDNFTPLIYIVVVFSAIDYITGVAAAIKNKDEGLSSKAAIEGAIKKLMYFVLIAVAFLIDYVITETSGTIGWDVGWTNLFGLLTVCYLISTEGISILENLTEWGIKIPFLSSALKIFREKILNKAPVNGDKEDANDDK